MVFQQKVSNDGIGSGRYPLAAVQHRHDADPTATFIIGAGLSGLVAATVLDREGYTVRIVDKGRSVGGRLATRRIGDAVLDHGAQFFTTRSDEFRAAVADWIDAGVVEEWCKGFDGDGDGHPRYRTVGGMNQLAKHLRAGLTDSAHLLTSHRAASIIPLADRYAITYDGAVREPDEAHAIVATAPVPQTLELLDSGGVRIDQRVSGVRDLAYHKVVGLLATIDRPAPFGPAGALQRPDDPVFTFCCDNSTKGISPVPAVTLARGAQLMFAAAAAVVTLAGTLGVPKVSVSVLPLSVIVDRVPDAPHTTAAVV